MSKQYIKILTNNLKHHDYQWKVGLNELEVFNIDNECTPDALYICEIKYFFKWMTLYPNMAYVGYVTIPEDAQTVLMEDKIKVNKVILHEPLIPLLDFIDTAIKHNADIHVDGQEPINWASRNGYLDIIKCLIEYGANIHSDDDDSLCWASSNGHLDVVKYLISRGADRATPNLGVAADIHTENDSALIYASEWGHLDVVECLIVHGANVHAGLALPRPDKVGRNDKALRWAYNNGHSAVVKYLTQ
jgi:ankyrin repeat protein